MIWRVASVLIFLSALLGSGALLSETRPFATVPMVREKFAWLDAHADDYDTLFLGTSRIYRGLDPALFDRLTAEAGQPTHSFNFGIDAMTPPEDAYVFERIAARRPKRLRWVFIEAGDLRPGLGADGAGYVRSQHWHDTTRTVLACQALLAPVGGRSGRSKSFFASGNYRQSLDLVGAHAWLWCTRTLNAGRGAWLCRSFLQPEPPANLPAILGRGGDGFVPVPADYQMPAAVRAGYEQLMASLAAKPSRVSYLDRDGQENLDDILAGVRALGAQPVVLIPPNLIRRRPHPQPGCEVPVLDYADIQRWPELFQIDKHIDQAHLNAAGAGVFTHIVAIDFIDLARRPANSR